ncbi:MAG: ABC transporter ATP-binding protein [Clostridia bacterium]|nr:ABC transporter ATP-binding protein [Clostridia bacterium]
MIELKHLHKFFNKGKQNEIHVINDVTLSLPERGMVAVFGRSGCGKTTLLNVIGGLDRFGSGTLTIDGQSIKNDTDTIRNRYIGYIFQNYNLSKEESCYDNVANALRLCGMADGKEMEERVNAALANVGMEHYAARTPDTLSGGQQQRIAIARAIVKNPRIILADEPTGNLDEANTVMIMDLLKQIAKDHLVLLVTHEANLVDYYCDTVVELQDGAVVSVWQNEGADGFVAKDKTTFISVSCRRPPARMPTWIFRITAKLPRSPCG